MPGLSAGYFPAAPVYIPTVESRLSCSMTSQNSEIILHTRFIRRPGGSWRPAHIQQKLIDAGFDPGNFYGSMTDMPQSSTDFSGTQEASPRRRGRPKLGVVAREPQHWDWLAAQPGGASHALRRLVDDAMRANSGQIDSRQAQHAAEDAAEAQA
jgi:hypothetical protein